jgi:hypothetical protein
MTLDQAIAKLRELNQPVPQPQRLPTEEEVAGIEERLGIQLHPDFRRYLLEASDVVYGALEPVTVTSPESHTDLYEVCRGAWEDYEVPRKLVPVCEDNGDFYCMDKKGQIVFWSADGATEDKWPNLANWIEEVWIGESGDDE